MRRAEDRTGKEYPGAEGAGIHPAGRGWQRGGRECLSSVWVRGWGGASSIRDGDLAAVRRGWEEACVHPAPTLWSALF